ncbi:MULTISPECIES: PepSY domain-containing protein [unclassified Meiothermus]|uniref:PepSY domain-containing protein n=1 Tax=unclassified Meiothermus TaxID=370471 RepID=UPI000D7C0C3F|nr:MULTISPECIES: PepSY domain-containing protein [unclassified Meiothermus]PZA06681.1 peptidase [Meiothermus sp. Pnk-1]RYM36607.1 peptidase [Meiothermus sp. PNK-Is4]
MKKYAKAILLAASALLSLAAFAQKTGQSSAQHPSYAGSLPVQENLSAQQYQAMAKISLQDAVKAAQAVLNTTAAPTKVKLGVENGYLVWEVVLAGQEIKVDAGSGKVLYQEAVGGQEENDGESHDENDGESNDDNG